MLPNGAIASARMTHVRHRPQALDDRDGPPDARPPVPPGVDRRTSVVSTLTGS
jgi:hypothetical protein